MAPSATSMLALVTRQHWLVMRRDGRLRLLGLALLVLFGAALAASAGRAHDAARRRIHDVAAEEQVWRAQGDANPHGAAHFGRYVYRPAPPLAVLDPGLMDQLGSTLRLEGHVQNTGRYKPSDRGAALSRFAGLTPAFALQVLVPLLIVFAAFPTFSGVRERRLLAQEIGGGARPGLLMLGRFVAMAGMLGLCLLAVGLLAWLATGATLGRDGAVQLAVLLGGYGLYWLAFLALTLALSAWASGERAALLGSLAFWTAAALLLPMLAPALAEQRHPTPTAAVFHAAVEREILDGPDGHDTRDARLAALRAATLKAYGVQRLEDLPINFDGLVFEHGERRTAQIYGRHFAALYDTYAAQARLAFAAAALSPLLALRPLSAALAQSDLPAHRHFLEQAEAYRYRMVQALNHDMKRNRKPGMRDYAANVAAITAGIPFEPRPQPLASVLARATAPLLALAAWLAAAIALMYLAALKMGERT
jgi:ABC-2 type transport system permease protein